MNVFNKVINFFKTPFKKSVIRSHRQSWFTFFNRDLATNETIFSAVNMRSNAIASAPVGVYCESRKLKPIEHKLAELFKFGPNTQSTMFDFIKCLEVNKCIKGKGYAIKQIGLYGIVTGLYLLNPDNVEPIIEKDSNELYYKISGLEEPRYVHNSYIIDVSFISSDGLKAINPLDVMRNTIDYDREVKEFSLNQMKKALKANYVIKLPDVKLSEDNIEQYDEMFESFVEAGVIYLDAGKEITELTTKSFLDPNIATIDKITIERVERVYGLNGKLSRTADNSKSNDTEDLIYLKDMILPNIRQYEQEFSKKLLSNDELMKGYEVKFSMQGFARATMEKRGNFYQQGLRSGWFCQDDIRELEDMPPLPDGLGKQFYISRDLCPVDMYRSFMESTINDQNKNLLVSKEKES